MNKIFFAFLISAACAVPSHVQGESESGSAIGDNRASACAQAKSRAEYGCCSIPRTMGKDCEVTRVESCTCDVTDRRAIDPRYQCETTAYCKVEDEGNDLGGLLNRINWTGTS